MGQRARRPGSTRDNSETAGGVKRKWFTLEPDAQARDTGSSLACASGSNSAAAHECAALPPGFKGEEFVQELPALAVEDAHTAHQRPKIELYGDSVFIAVRTAQMNHEHHIEFGETHFFVGKNFIVSVRHGSSVPYT